MSDVKAEHFRVGDEVRYVPHHAKGDRSHPDCENGVVTSTNAMYVFVRYGTNLRGQATNPDDLLLVRSYATPSTESHD